MQLSARRWPCEFSRKTFRHLLQLAWELVAHGSTSPPLTLPPGYAAYAAMKGAIETDLGGGKRLLTYFLSAVTASSVSLTCWVGLRSE